MPGEERRLDLGDLALASLGIVLDAGIHRLSFSGPLRSTPSVPSGVFSRQQTGVGLPTPQVSRALPCVRDRDRTAENTLPEASGVDGSLGESGRSRFYLTSSFHTSVSYRI
jgi:hypothetical protein